MKEQKILRNFSQFLGNSVLYFDKFVVNLFIVIFWKEMTRSRPESWLRGRAVAQNKRVIVWPG